ncbi:MAG TPA: AIPR family protein, partial [Stellaceae bacterium]|nr:AIPR family protein [Stellaceae bacterium]
MDRITTSMLSEFAAENGLSSRQESDQFEHFASYATVQRLHPATFDTSDVVLGGQEPGIDGIAIVVNGVLVPDMDTFLAVSDATSTLDVIFVFVQADRSRSFETGKISNIVFAVRDFFKDSPQLPRTERLNELAAIQAAIYAQSAKFKRSNPSCFLFYVTTGEWTGDTQLDARRQSGVAELRSESIFSTIEFECIGADILQRLYRQTKNAIERDFTFSSHIVAPEIPGVKEAYLGVLPAKDLLSLITSDDGEIARGLFESNIRDFQGYNQVNDAIKSTLDSDHKARFVLMNNGVTIIARVLQRTAHRFHIEDFQIVNGCQTSNVLFEHRDNLDDVVVPLRLIASDDE